MEWLVSVAGASVAVLVLFAAVIVCRASHRRVAALERESMRTVRESEARLRLQIERLPVACITVSCDLILTSWNQAAERIFGYSAAEIVGRPSTVLLPNEWASDVEERWSRLLDGDAAAHGINENRTKDGRTIVCRWTNTPLVEADGTVVGVLGVAEDITEWRQAEARHKELLDQLPHHIFGLDAEDRYTAVNATACRYFQREESEIVGRTALELGVPPALAEQWAEQNARTRESGVTQRSELTMPTADGGRSFRAITNPVHDLSGAVVGVTGISIDTTDLRAAEAAAERLLRAVEQLDEVVFTTDRDGRITYTNSAFEKVYGYSPQEVLGHTPRILKSGQLSGEFYAAFWTELLSGKSLRLEYSNQRKDGTKVDVIGTASPILDDCGNVTGFIAVQQDVTEQNRAAEEQRRFEERVAHLQRMESLGTLAGGLAHDFNNILSIILCHTSLLERRGSDPAVVKRVTGTVQQAVQRGAALARQILTFARRTEIRGERVILAQLLVELGSMISETFPRTIELTLDLDPDLPPLWADAGQLHQALLNLCINARDAMPSGGGLTLAARRMAAAAMVLRFPDARLQDYVEITVRDTGEGMDEATLGRIFEPFFTTKERGKGTGLGLATVYGVVNKHGGVVDVDSRVGEGTAFRLYLPVMACVETSPIERRETRAEGRGTLLLVDDETAVLDAVSEQLRDHGYSVQTAENGPEAIEKCRRGERPPDAVVMDLGMPRMSPIELLRELRAIAPSIPVVAMTGYVEPDVHAAVAAAGVQRILAKPFEIVELLGALRDVLL